MPESPDSRIKKLVVHYVGNKLMDEGVKLSRRGIDLASLAGRDLIEKWFLSPFVERVYHRLTHATSLELNEVYTVAREVFASPGVFFKKSRDLASILYEYATHPKVKAGECYVAYFENVEVGGEVTDAIAMFKTETRESFIRVTEDEGSFDLSLDDGINLRKPDKGFILFNVHEEDGYRLCIVDNQNNQEAQYWKDSFLKANPVADSYFHTQQYLSLAKRFVTEQLDDEFEVSRADQIDYLNRSLKYFKEHESFDEQEFADQVFEHREVIQSFKRFKGAVQEEDDTAFVGQFDIATAAVKRNASIFKSVLKLDKNFHIYIHGDRNLIERGIDPDGRKYYKIYYKEEQ